MTRPGGVASMTPAYFALVMATGIVSLACHVLGYDLLAKALLLLNLAFYPLLWGLTLVRVVRYRPELIADLRHHGRSVGFFTTVAGTCVLGSQLLLIAELSGVALVVWIAGVVLWAILVYAIFAIIITKPEKPALAEGINGGWLVSVVAAQSVSVLGSQLAPLLGEQTPQILFFCLAMWLGAGMLYLWIIGLIFYRYAFFTMNPSDLAPPYWINMGAAAISTLAGTMLVAQAPHSPVIQQTLPFVRGLTIMWWATATWWIPMLVILGAWRHIWRGFPLRYDPLYWGAVFPLGMYTVCTARLSVTIEAAYLRSIAQVFLFIALAAWALTAAGMAHHLVRRTSAGSD